MLKDETDVRSELARRVLPGIEAGDHDPAAELTTRAVRNQAVEAAKQRRLSAARRAAEQDHLAGFDGGRDLAQGRPVGLRVAIADGIKRDDGHGPLEKGWRGRRAPPAGRRQAAERGWAPPAPGRGTGCTVRPVTVRWRRWR